MTISVITEDRYSISSMKQRPLRRVEQMLKMRRVGSPAERYRIGGWIQLRKDVRKD